MLVKKKLNLFKVILANYVECIYFITLSTIVYILYSEFLITELAIPFGPIGTMGTAVVILMGFRNSSSYSRWWEARKIWGGMINDSRSFARCLISYTFLHTGDKGKESKEWALRCVNRHIAYVTTLKNAMRDKEEVLLESKSKLPTDEFAMLHTVSNKPTQLLQIQGKEIQIAYSKGFISEFERTDLTNLLNKICDHQGKSERIKKTPLPVYYSYFTNSFLGFFLFLIPFGFIDQIKEITVPLSVSISFIYMVLNRVGEELEKPFENKDSDIPLDSICNTIEIDLLEQSGQIDIVPKKVIPNKKGVLM